MSRAREIPTGTPEGKTSATGPFKRFFVTLGLLASGWFCIGAGPIDGATLFEKGNYREAREVLSRALAEAPEDPLYHFYMGRTLLAMEEAAGALPHFERSVQLAPENATYHFWLGVACWALLDLDRELEAYDRALAIDPDFMPAHVYAGHNQLDRGHWEPALEHYTRVLEMRPEHPEALYNAGVALEALGRGAEAAKVWRRYLQHHRSGDLAIDTVRHLNLAGDFSYRAFAVGKRFIAGPSPGFADDTLTVEPQLIDTLKEIGAIIRTNEAPTLHVVTFVLGDAELAEQRARAVKRVLGEHFPDLPRGRVRLSWFGEAEAVTIEDDHHRLNSSINIFTATSGGMGPRP